MTKTIFASALALSLALGSAAYAQSPPVGGPDAKGNAPIKHVHTVNDGSAKPGANSFTEGQARQHIVNSGYSNVTGLTKGQDGVWRGAATHNGGQVNVAMDFKGNVTEAGGAGGGSAMTSGNGASSAADTNAGGGDHAGMAAGGMAAGGMAAGAMAMHHHHHHHHMRRHHHGRCANPGPNGAACSGIDTTGDGVSDREKRAMQAGAHP